MKAGIRYILVRLVILLVLINALMYFQQPYMVFYPYRELVSTPSDWGLEYREVRLTTTDGVGLHGWYLPRHNTGRALLFFHGNGGNISHRRDSLLIFNRLGFSTLIIDYRGYGKSEGSPDEAGLARDAEAAWRYLTESQGFASKDIVIFGRSLGGAVASKLAGKVGPRALILESTFSSARDMANEIYPVVSRMLVMRYDFETAQYVRQVHCPVLVVHSRADDIIPFELGKKVYQAANPPKQFVTLRGDHNTGFLSSQPYYENKLAEFLSSL